MSFAVINKCGWIPDNYDFVEISGMTIIEGFTSTRSAHMRIRFRVPSSRFQVLPGYVDT